VDDTLKDFKESVVALIASYFVLDIEYAEDAKLTLEFQNAT
jgi:hypothetical protein